MEEQELCCSVCLCEFDELDDGCTIVSLVSPPESQQQCSHSLCSICWENCKHTAKCPLCRAPVLTVVLNRLAADLAEAKRKQEDDRKKEKEQREEIERLKRELEAQLKETNDRADALKREADVIKRERDAHVGRLADLEKKLIEESEKCKELETKSTQEREIYEQRVAETKARIAAERAQLAIKNDQISVKTEQSDFMIDSSQELEECIKASDEGLISKFSSFIWQREKGKLVVPLEEFQVFEKRGCTAKSKVWRALHDPSKRPVAIKLITKGAISKWFVPNHDLIQTWKPGEKVVSSLMYYIMSPDKQNNRESPAKNNNAASLDLHEAILLHHLSHPCIPKLLWLASNQRKTHSFLVLPYYQADLKYLLDSKQFNLTETMGVAHQLVHCLAYLHSAEVSHRNMSLANVMIERSARGAEVRLVGFSAARTNKKRTGSMKACQLGALNWAPESIVLGPEEVKDWRPVDMWALGAMLLEIARHGRHPFLPQGPGVKPCSQPLSVLTCQLSIRECAPDKASIPADLPNYADRRLCSSLAISAPGRVPLASLVDPSDASKISPNNTAPFFSLVKSLLEFYPQDRISAEAALSHPFFASLPASLQTPFERCTLPADLFGKTQMSAFFAEFACGVS